MTWMRSRTPRTILVCGLLAMAYVIAGRLGLALAFVHASATAVWPPTGLALAALLLLGFRVWPGILLGAFLVNVLTAGSVATSLAIAIGNTAEALAGAALVTRHAHGRRVFVRAEDVFRFGLFAALAATVVSATVGPISLSLGGEADWSAYGAIWLTWWVGDAVGALVVTPFLVLWARDPVLRWARTQQVEALILLASLVAASLAVFTGWSPLTGRHSPLAFLCIPPLVWAALRFGPREVATGTVVLSGIALWGTLHGHGPFARTSPNESLLLLQAFIGVITLMVLAVSAGVWQRARVERALRGMTARLERHVAARTRDLRAANEELRLRIAEHERSESALQQSEQRYRQLFDNANDVVYTIDLQGFFTSINRAGERVSGYTRDEARRMHIDDVVVPEYRALTREMLARKLAGDTTPVYTIEMVTKDGRRLPFELNSGLIFSDGVAVGVQGIARDVSERTRAQELLHRSEARLRSILDIAQDAIISIDEGQRITLFNQGAERIFGYSAGEMLGQPLDRLLPARLGDAHARHVKTFAASPERARHMGARDEILGRRKDGTEFPAEASISKFLQAGQPVFTVILRDITERKLLEDQFRQAQKLEAIGRLAGGVAHDFNNLLTAILGYSDLLLTQLNSSLPISADLRQIHGAATRGATLTRQLLALSRRQVLQLAPVDLNTVVQATDQLVRRIMGEDVRIDLRLGAGLLPIEADAMQLEQVLMNLLVNARDALPLGGTVTIETSEVVFDAASGDRPGGGAPGRYVRLTVTDDGTGMSEETMQRVFEPFFTTKEAGKGTGLGLATVYGIVKQLGGSIRVSSELGCGTTFTMHFPCIAATGASAVPREAVALGLGREVILLVEDDDMVREYAGAALRRHGYRVIEAADAPDAVARFGESAARPDLLLTDIVLPGMNGRALAETLRRRARCLKVLFTTGYAEDAVFNRRGDGEHGDLLEKPFTPEALLSTVRTVLDRPSQ